MGEASGSGSSPAGVGGDDLTKEYPCLIRATDGQDKKSKVKLSTLVRSHSSDQQSGSCADFSLSCDVVVLCSSGST